MPYGLSVSVARRSQFFRPSFEMFVRSARYSGFVYFISLAAPGCVGTWQEKESAFKNNHIMSYP